VRIGPRPAGSAAGRREARFIARKLRAAGVRKVRVQRPFGNVVGEIPGSDSGHVVVGAHYDTKDISGFVGANDGASGVAVVLELARDLPAHLQGPSVNLALFDAEESKGSGLGSFERTGDRGSRQYVRYAREGGRQGAPPVEQISAMVLFDMVGDCHLEIPLEETSDPSLYQPFVAAASTLTGSAAPFVGTSSGIEDDHTPFEQAGIPAVDLIDFDYGPGRPPGDYWHTPADNLRHVCPRSLAEVGRPALAAIPAIR
jgi:Zn-dependent M28 family amino/carboxypeptidase